MQGLMVKDRLYFKATWTDFLLVGDRETNTTLIYRLAELAEFWEHVDLIKLIWVP